MKMTEYLTKGYTNHRDTDVWVNFAGVLSILMVITISNEIVLYHYIVHVFWKMQYE